MPALDLWPTCCPRCLSGFTESKIGEPVRTCHYCQLTWDNNKRNVWLIHTKDEAYRALMKHIEQNDGRPLLAVPEQMVVAMILDQRRRLTERYVLLLNHG